MFLVVLSSVVAAHADDCLKRLVKMAHVRETTFSSILCIWPSCIGVCLSHCGQRLMYQNAPRCWWKTPCSRSLPVFFALFCDVTKLIVPISEPTTSEHLGSCTEFWCLKDFYVTDYFLLCMQVKCVEDTYD